MDPTIKDFESAISELETIVKRLEDGDLALEKSLELFERGVQLSRFCHSKLEEAERRVEILTERGDVKPAPASLGAESRRPRSFPVTTAPADLGAWLESRRQAVDRALEKYLPLPGTRPDAPGFIPAPQRAPSRVTESMRYSVFAGGKRLRPVLALASAGAIAERVELEDDDAEALAMPVACALELIHTYSLVHDDLPAMDNDTMRRGRPTAHVVFGEGIGHPRR